MVGVVGIGRGDAGEHVLVRLARQQVAVLKRGLAEIGQQRIAGAVHLHFPDQLQGRTFALSGCADSASRLALDLSRFAE